MNRNTVWPGTAALTAAISLVAFVGVKALWFDDGMRNVVGDVVLTRR